MTFPTLVAATLVDALSNAAAGAVIGAFLAIGIAEGIRYLRKPRAEYLGIEHSPEFPPGTFYGIGRVGANGRVRVHKIRFKVRGDVSDPAAVELRWRSEHTFAKWDELSEPLLCGHFEAALVPSTFFLPVTHGESYHLPILVEYDDTAGNRTCDVFCGWWYGQGRIRRPMCFTVIDSDHLEVTLVGLKWQKRWRPWPRRRGRQFRVSELRGL